MPVLSNEIKYYGSGASNLGGAKSGTEVNFSTLFDNVEPAEAVAGDTEYRIIYVENTSATDSLTAAKFFVVTDTVAGNTSIEIGVGAAAVNGTESTIANENTAPAGVTFSAPTTKVGGLDIPDLAPGDYKSICYKRSIGAGASSGSESATTEISGNDS